MTTFTLRLDQQIARKLQAYCKKNSLTKTGFIKQLIRDFFKQQQNQPTAFQSQKKLSDLIGIISLGGDAVEDTEGYYE